MGRLHARVYGEIPRVRLVGVYDADPEAAGAAAEQYDCRAFGSLEELLTSVSAVTIAVPTQFHADTAEKTSVWPPALRA